MALRTRDVFKVWSLGDPDASEAEIIRRFFDGIEKYTPDLVSWNGAGFDLPVLHYRALRQGVVAQRYWESGDADQAFRWNNYLNRYHTRHLDLMDVLSGYQGRARISLQAAATLLGFPGKLGMSGDKVWEAWLEGGIEQIRNYCETDVLNTFLDFPAVRAHARPSVARGICRRSRPGSRGVGGSGATAFSGISCRLEHGGTVLMKSAHAREPAPPPLFVPVPQARFEASRDSSRRRLSTGCIVESSG